MNAAERQMRAKIGAHTNWANTVNRSARTLPARMAMEAKFVREADPENKLAPAERVRTAGTELQRFTRWPYRQDARCLPAKSRPPTGRMSSIYRSQLAHYQIL